MANLDLTPEVVLALGRAAARVLGGCSLVVGREPGSRGRCWSRASAAPVLLPDSFANTWRAPGEIYEPSKAELAVFAREARRGSEAGRSGEVRAPTSPEPPVGRHPDLTADPVVPKNGWDGSE